MIDKFVRSVAEAMAGIKDGSTVLIAGFAQVGEPRALIDGLIETGARDLTVVHNTAGRGREGVAQLTIVQTQHVAELGDLSPEDIVTPGIYVDRVVHLECGDPPIKIE